MLPTGGRMFWVGRLTKGASLAAERLRPMPAIILIRPLMPPKEAAESAALGGSIMPTRPLHEAHGT